MSELNNQQTEGLIGEFLKEQLTHVKKSNNGENNSFVFLEKSTLNVLLEYLLTGNKRSANAVMNDEFGGVIVAKLDEMIENNKMEFEDIINKLKNLS
ncbi:hypothetical protein [Solibacillus sp. FSL K6-1523]|uniref:hypothetical protein n=1 Tax=Solibacillus sp. FSL K6-1523 TaxID=2921471 RepID=UPI0030F53F97